MKVGIIGAMDVEVAYLKERLEGRSVTERASMEFNEGTLGGVPVVVVKCGIGKVNAGICAQILCDLFDVTHVINTGVAGSLDNAINIGDVVVSIDAVHHDMDVTALGYAPGHVPGFDALSFPADAHLRAAATEAVRSVAPSIGVFEGRVASGDQFVSTQSQKEKIIDTFGGLCTEMEGASIAHACWLSGVPFVIVRAISDKADGSSTVDYPTFEKQAAEHCAKIVEHMVAGMF